MKKKNHYLDVVVLEERRIRVDFEMSGKLSTEKILKMLQDGDYNDITDEETFEYKEVLSFDSNEEDAE